MVSEKTDRVAEFKINWIIIGLSGLLFFAIPHIIHRSIYYTAVNAKYFFSELFILLISGIWLVHYLFSSRQIKLKRHPIQLPLLCFLAYLVLRILTHPLPQVGLNDSLPWILSILLSLLLIQVIETKKQIWFLLGCILAGASLSAIHGIFQYYGQELPALVWKGKPRIGTYVVIGTLGNANFMAEYLIPIFFLSLCQFIFSFHKTGRLAIGLVIAIITGFCIWLTGANEVWVILPFLLIFFLLFSLFAFRKKPQDVKKEIIYTLKYPILIVLICSLFIGIGIYGATRSSNWSLLKNQYRLVFDRNAYSDRLMVWEVANRMIIEKPIWGWGMGEFRISYLQELAIFLRNPENATFNKEAISTQGANANQTHNDYLQMTVDLGIIGFGLFLWIIIVFFKTIFKELQKSKNREQSLQRVGWMVFVVAVLLDMTINFPLFLPVTGLLFWTILGIASADSLVNEEKHEYRKEKDKFVLLGKCSAVIGFILVILLAIHTWHRIIASQSLKDGMSSLSQEQWKEADLKLQKAIYYDPTVGETYLRRTQVLLELNQASEAVKNAFLSFQYGTGDVERYYLLAKAILLNGEPQRAIEILNTATFLYPQYSDAYELQAQIYSDTLHHPKLAIECWQKYIQSGISEQEKESALQQIVQLQKKL